MSHDKHTQPPSLSRPGAGSSCTAVSDLSLHETATQQNKTDKNKLTLESKHHVIALNHVIAHDNSITVSDKCQSSSVLSEHTSNNTQGYHSFTSAGILQSTNYKNKSAVSTHSPLSEQKHEIREKNTAIDTEKSSSETAHKSDIIAHKIPKGKSNKGADGLNELWSNYGHNDACSDRAINGGFTVEGGHIGEGVGCGGGGKHEHNSPSSIRQPPGIPSPPSEVSLTEIVSPRTGQAQVGKEPWDTQSRDSSQSCDSGDITIDHSAHVSTTATTITKTGPSEPAPAAFPTTTSTNTTQQRPPSVSESASADRWTICESRRRSPPPLRTDSLPTQPAAAASQANTQLQTAVHLNVAATRAARDQPKHADLAAAYADIVLKTENEFGDCGRLADENSVEKYCRVTDGVNEKRSDRHLKDSHGKVCISDKPIKIEEKLDTSSIANVSNKNDTISNLDIPDRSKSLASHSNKVSLNQPNQDISRQNVDDKLKSKHIPHTYDSNHWDKNVSKSSRDRNGPSDAAISGCKTENGYESSSYINVEECDSSESDIDVGQETMASDVAVSYQYSITKVTDHDAAAFDPEVRSRKVHATTFTPEIGAVSGSKTAEIASTAGPKTSPSREAKSPSQSPATMTSNVSSPLPMQDSLGCHGNQNNGDESAKTGGNSSPDGPVTMVSASGRKYSIAVTKETADWAEKSNSSLNSMPMEIDRDKINAESVESNTSGETNSVLDLSFTCATKVPTNIQSCDMEVSTASSTTTTQKKNSGGKNSTKYKNKSVPPPLHLDKTISTSNGKKSTALSSPTQASQNAIIEQHRSPITDNSTKGKAEVGVDKRQEKSSSASNVVGAGKGRPQSASVLNRDRSPESVQTSSPYYMSFDPRILQFYTDEDRKKLVETGFIPQLYSPTISSPGESPFLARGAAAVDSLRLPGSRFDERFSSTPVSRSLSLDTGNTAFPEYHLFKSITDKFMSDLANSAKSSSVLSTQSSDKVMSRQSSQSDSKSSNQPAAMDTTFGRQWSAIDTSNRSRSEQTRKGSKLSEVRDSSRKRANSPAQQNTGAIPVGIAIARKRPDSLDRKDSERQRSVTSSGHGAHAQTTEAGSSHRESTRTSTSSALNGSGLTSNLIVTGGGHSSLLNLGVGSPTSTSDRLPTTTKPPTPSLSTPHTPSVSGGGYWLGHGVYSLPPPSRDGAQLQYNPPPGYKIGQDPVTRQLYVIPDISGSYYGCLSPQQPSPVATSRSPSDSRRTPSTPSLLSPPPTDPRRTPTSLPSTPLLSPGAVKTLQRQDTGSKSGLISPGGSSGGGSISGAASKGALSLDTHARKDLLSPSLLTASGRKTPPSGAATAAMASPALMPPHPFLSGLPPPPIPATAPHHPYGYPYPPYSPYFWNPSAYAPHTPAQTQPRSRTPTKGASTVSMQNRGTSPVDFSSRKANAKPATIIRDQRNVTIQTLKAEVVEACVQTVESSMVMDIDAIKTEKTDETTSEDVKKSFTDHCVQTDQISNEKVSDNGGESNVKCRHCQCSCQMDKSKSQPKSSVIYDQNSSQTNTEQTGEAVAQQQEHQSATSCDLALNSMDGLHILSTLALHSTAPIPSFVPPSSIRNDLTKPLSIDTSMMYSHRCNVPSMTSSSLSPDLASDYNVPRASHFSAELLRRRPSKASSVSEDEVSSVFKIGAGPEHMDPKEVEVRSKLAELQRRYRERQKQLAKLKESSDSKKSAGRISKRRRSTKSQSSDSAVPLTSTPGSPVTAVNRGAHAKPVSCPRTKAQMKYMQPGVRSLSKLELSSPKPVTRHSLSDDSDMGELSSMLEDTRLEAGQSYERRSAVKKLPFSASFHDSSSSSNTSGNTSNLSILAQYASSQMEHAAASKSKKRRKMAAQKSDDSCDIPAKKRKPGRPKKYSKDQAVTQTLVSKSTKHFSFFNVGKSVRRMKAVKEGNRTSLLQAVSEWNRRRSERIFLSDALSPKSTCSSLSQPTSAQSSPAPSGPIKPSILSPMTTASGERTMRTPTLAERVMKPAILKPGSEGLLAGMDKVKTYGRQNSQATPTSAVVRDRYTFHSDSSDSESETDATSCSSDEPPRKPEPPPRNPEVIAKPDVPPKKLEAPKKTEATKRKSPTPTPVAPEEPSRSSSPIPEVRSSVLSQTDLYDGLTILYFMEGLFYEARVKEIQPPDVYGVIVKGERGNRPHILSREELLNDAVLDIRPPSLGNVPIGRRICAYWSQQFSCLYPGLVVKPNPVAKGGGSKTHKLVSVEFDDGDDGNIPLEHVRLLPQEFPMQSYDDDEPEPSPGKRKKRSISEDLLADSWRERKPSLPDTLTRYQVMERLKAEAKRKMELFNQQQKQKQPPAPGKSQPENQPKPEIATPRATTPARQSSLSPGRKQGTKKFDRSVSVVGTSSTKSPSNPKKLDRSMSVGALANKSKKASSSSKKNQNSKMADNDSSEDDSDDESSDDEMSDAFSEDHEPMDEDENSKNRTPPTATATKTKKSASAKKSASKTVTPRKKSESGSGKSKTPSSMKKRERKSEKAAVLPAHQIWEWEGPGKKRPKKTFYTAIRRGKETLRLSECAVFLTVGRPNLPYIGRIESLFETRGGNMTVKVKWFYHPEETKGGKRLAQIKGALYESPHEDENDVQTISHKCDVMSFTRYKALLPAHSPGAHAHDRPSVVDMDNVYYLAGFYDPTMNLIKFEGDVKVQGKNW